MKGWCPKCQEWTEHSANRSVERPDGGKTITITTACLRCNATLSTEVLKEVKNGR